MSPVDMRVLDKGRNSMNIPVLDMVLRSGWMGRIVVVLLVTLSLMTWAIIFNRFYVLGRIAQGNKNFRRRYGSIGKISEIENLDERAMHSPMAQLGRVGALEYRRIIDDAQRLPPAKDWSFFIQNQFTMASEHVSSAFTALVSTFDKGCLLLAMASSIAPFLGLLGTVWGIMNAFFEIGNQGSASLPVVAPGIAEALITTIVGLIVAIPAMFFYNFFNHRAERLENEMDEFKQLLEARVKREILNLLYTERPPRAAPAGPQGQSRM
jgi:biopolymer transport protein TolQ